MCKLVFKFGSENLGFAFWGIRVRASPEVGDNLVRVVVVGKLNKIKSNFFLSFIFYDNDEIWYKSN
jgi:hypothetical protein